jgi:PST family polysaccharide transporter
MNNFNKKVAKATKWSGITTLLSRLISPISSMVLARLLTPEAFGVVTTMAMIISFADLLTDAGFQKYLIQHEFKDDVDRNESTNVAFWSNFIMSLLLWGVIIVFADPLAALVGNPGLGHVLIIACVAIPLAAFSSIQMALYRRDLNFKTLFKIRLVSLFIPLVVTVPLAFWLRSYWALVFGNIFRHTINAILLTYFSPWKPRFFYSFAKLKEMLSFSLWSLAEAISIWMTMNFDIFIVGTMLNQHYLGLYKISTTTVAQIVTIITASTTPVLFSSLSRLQNDDNSFQKLFFKFQKLIGMLVIPIGFGIFCFSDFITDIYLGSQWTEASGFIGLWGLMSALTIVLSHYCSEVFRAKGRPKLSVLCQWLHIIALWPVIIIFVKYGFQTLYMARSLVRIQGIIVGLSIMYFQIHFPVLKMITNVIPSILASILMMISAFILKSFNNSTAFNILYILICTLIYLISIQLFPTERKMFNKYIVGKIKTAFVKKPNP